MAHFGIKFGFDAPTASDVGTRELTVSVNGVEPPLVQSLASSALISDQVVFNDGDVVSVTLVDIDTHGNRGPASTALAFTVVDDIPPGAPNIVAIAEKVQLD